MGQSWNRRKKPPLDTEDDEIVFDSNTSAVSSRVAPTRHWRRTIMRGLLIVALLCLTACETPSAGPTVAEAAIEPTVARPVVVPTIAEPTPPSAMVAPAATAASTATVA